jgi:hypothetical protein
MARLAPVALVVALSLAASGCGGGGGASDKRPKVGGQFIGGVLNCLYDDNWLAQPGEANQIIGTSESGVTFRLTFYPTTEKAEAADKKAKGEHELIETGVVEYNLPGFQQAGGGSQGVKPTTESATIKKCIDQANA